LPDEIEFMWAAARSVGVRSSVVGNVNTVHLPVGRTRERIEHGTMCEQQRRSTTRMITTGPIDRQPPAYALNIEAEKRAVAMEHRATERAKCISLLNVAPIASAENNNSLIGTSGGSTLVPISCRRVRTAVLKFRTLVTVDHANVARFIIEVEASEDERL